MPNTGSSATRIVAAEAGHLQEGKFSRCHAETPEAKGVGAGSKPRLGGGGAAPVCAFSSRVKEGGWHVLWVEQELGLDFVAFFEGGEVWTSTWRCAVRSKGSEGGARRGADPDIGRIPLPPPVSWSVVQRGAVAHFRQHHPGFDLFPLSPHYLATFSSCPVFLDSGRH